MLSSLAGPSPELRRLLETKLDTFEKLELVVLLSKRAPMVASMAELERELQVGHDVMKRLVDEIARTRIVEITGEQVRLVAAPDELAAIAEGADLEPRKVISLLSSIAFDRVRGMAARSFADAFTLRKKKDDGDG